MSDSAAALLASTLSDRDRLTALAQDEAVIRQVASLCASDSQATSLLEAFRQQALSTASSPRSPEEVLPPGRTLLVVGVDGVSSRCVHPYGAVGTTNTFPHIVKALGVAFGGTKGELTKRAHAFLRRENVCYVNVFRGKPFVADEVRSTEALTQLQRAEDVGHFLSLTADMASAHNGPLRLLGFGSGAKMINMQLEGLCGLGPTLPEGVGGSTRLLSSEIRAEMGTCRRWRFMQCGNELGLVHMVETVHLAHMGVGEGLLTTLHLGRVIAQLMRSTSWEDVEELLVDMPEDYDPKEQLALLAWEKSGKSAWDLQKHVNYFQIEKGVKGTGVAPDMLTEDSICSKCQHVYAPGSVSKGWLSVRKSRCPPCAPSHVRQKRICGAIAMTRNGCHVVPDAEYCRGSVSGGCEACKRARP